MAEDDAFKPGDVVRLKSGGPAMTVEKVHDGAEGRRVAVCVWFKDVNAERTSSLALPMFLLEKAQMPLG